MLTWSIYCLYVTYLVRCALQCLYVAYSAYMWHTALTCGIQRCSKCPYDAVQQYRDKPPCVLHLRTPATSHVQPIGTRAVVWSHRRFLITCYQCEVWGVGRWPQSIAPNDPKPIFEASSVSFGQRWLLSRSTSMLWYPCVHRATLQHPYDYFHVKKISPPRPVYPALLLHSG